MLQISAASPWDISFDKQQYTANKDNSTAPHIDEVTIKALYVDWIY